MAEMNTDAWTYMGYGDAIKHNGYEVVVAPTPGGVALSFDRAGGVEASFELHGDGKVVDVYPPEALAGEPGIHRIQIAQELIEKAGLNPQLKERCATLIERLEVYQKV